MVAVKISYLILVVVIAFSITFQLVQLWQFVRVGPRFTAHDGQELCERVKALEERSYGFRDAGKMPLDCQYKQH